MHNYITSTRSISRGEGYYSWYKLRRLLPAYRTHRPRTWRHSMHFIVLPRHNLSHLARELFHNIPTMLSSG